MKKSYIKKVPFLAGLLIFMIISIHFNAFAQLSITGTGINYTIDFENTVSGVNNDSIKGTGFTSSPAAFQFDSDAWAATGWSDGAMNFGDTKTSGDYARGLKSAPVTTGGFYAFIVSPGNHAFGIQPGGSDWAPGTLTLRIQNNTGFNLSSISISYNIYVRNDQERGNSFNFSHSINNSTYTAVAALDYTSPATSTGTDWIIVPRTTTITGLNLPIGSYYYFRWNGADVSGTGSRDEFALNDIVINVQPVAGVADPSAFNAIPVSTSQVDLSWTQNGNSNNVMVAWNSTYTFGTPSGTYSAGDPVAGGGTVLYNGPMTSFSHSGLSSSTEYFYKAWSVDGSNIYSAGVVDSATTQFPEPTNHPTGLAAASNGPVSVTVSWTDSDAAHYLVKGSNSGYGSITVPVDGTAEPNSLLARNVEASIQQYQFTGLTPNTQYYFKIFPYNGGGESANYKTDGTVPEATATTDILDIALVISEVADPLDNFNCRYVELYNTGSSLIDFSSDVVYLCRQANGNPASWASVMLTGTLPASEAYTVALSSLYFDTAYNQTADLYSNIVTVSGNDGIFLCYGGNQSTGFLFDAFGQIDIDGNGTAWEYTDGHAVRKRTVTGNNTTWTNNEWAIVRNVNYHNMTPGMHAADVTWQGTTSSGWNKRGNNWSGIYGFVPDASCNVTIPNVTNYPVVTEPSACHQVQILSGSTLKVQSPGSLLIAGP